MPVIRCTYYFLEEFINREMQYLMDGGKFIVYLPELRIISFTDGKITEQAMDFLDAEQVATRR